MWNSKVESGVLQMRIVEGIGVIETGVVKSAATGRAPKERRLVMPTRKVGLTGTGENSLALVYIYSNWEMRKAYA